MYASAMTLPTFDYAKIKQITYRILFVVLVVGSLQVKMCPADNDYDTHNTTANNAENTLND